jgi:hypothetical protein
MKLRNARPGDVLRVTGKAALDDNGKVALLIDRGNGDGAQVGICSCCCPKMEVELVGQAQRSVFDETGTRVG